MQPSLRIRTLFAGPVQGVLIPDGHFDQARIAISINDFIFMGLQLSARHERSGINPVIRDRTPLIG